MKNDRHVAQKSRFYDNGNNGDLMKQKCNEQFKEGMSAL